MGLFTTPSNLLAFNSLKLQNAQNMRKGLIDESFFHFRIFRSFLLRANHRNIWNIPLETYVDLKAFSDNPGFKAQRQASLDQYDRTTIDPPMVEIIEGFMKRPHCFTLQSCYGHFLYQGQTDLKNTATLPISGKITDVDYRIAYIALCIENSQSGRDLFGELEKIQVIDPDYIQFGCADWFWKKQVNSFVIQVEPERHRNMDRIIVGFKEARHIEKVRNDVLDQLRKIVKP